MLQLAKKQNSSNMKLRRRERGMVICLIALHAVERNSLLAGATDNLMMI